MEVGQGDPLRPPVQSDPLVGRRPKRSKPFSASEAARIVEALSSRLGHRFKDSALLARALVHPSAAHQATESNQRLEFVGDRVLGVVIATMLNERFPDESEGALSRRFTALVRRETLARIAQELDLGSQLILGKGEEEGGGREAPSNLADACEAVIAAVFWDGGFSAARRFVHRHWSPLLDEVTEPPQDAKTALQEWSQGARGVLPRYRLVREHGPPHAPTFEVEVSVEGLPPVFASGRTKQAAEQAAAAELLDSLEARRD